MLYRSLAFPSLQLILLWSSRTSRGLTKEAGVDGRIVAALGIHNIKNYEGPEEKLIICADNDGIGARTQEITRQAQEHFQNQGKHVDVIRPYKEGYDFNDVLTAEGIQGIRDALPQYTRDIESSQGQHVQNPRGVEQREAIIPKHATYLEEKLREVHTRSKAALFRVGIFFKLDIFL